MRIDIYNTNNTYDLILADPPWKQKKGGKKSVRPDSSGKELDYPVCTLDEIKSHLKQADQLVRGRTQSYSFGLQTNTYLKHNTQQRNWVTNYMRE